MAKDAETMLTFLQETTLDGYQQLVDVGQSYQDNTVKLREMMTEFSAQFIEYENAMGNLENSVEEVGRAVEDGTSAIFNVSQTSAALNENTQSVKEDAENNMEIAKRLKSEAGKFIIE